MPRCPKCGAEIDHLIYYESGWLAYTYDGKDYIRAEGLDIFKGSAYACPICGEFLFESETKAQKFLRGE